jgi:CspA family cold shock protein
VKWFNFEKGFGFLSNEDDSAGVFAHHSAIASIGYRSQEGNQKVQFDVVQGPKGPQAENGTAPGLLDSLTCPRDWLPRDD